MTVDPRFYAPLGALTLETISGVIGTAPIGDSTTEVTGISSVANARRGDIAFLDGDGKTAPTLSPDLSALIVNETNVVHVPDAIPYVVVGNPRSAHGCIALKLFAPRHLNWHSQIHVSADASVHETARLAPGVAIGDGAVIGEHTVIGANSVIGPGVQIGRYCQIGANVSLVCALLGDHVKLLAGSRIGETGFGVTPGDQGLEDSLHFGRVILQDNVTVGANSCIDRGVFDDTILGERTKIDNLCQIAHNVVFGRSVVMAAFGGISGSVTVGDGVTIAGRVGIADHVKVSDGARLAASAGVFRDIGVGETWGGTPAKPFRQWMREVAWVQRQAAAKKPK